MNPTKWITGLAASTLISATAFTDAIDTSIVEIGIADSQGNIIVNATAEDAIGTTDGKNTVASAWAKAYAIDGNVSDDISGVINITAEGGEAVGSRAYAYTDSVGVNGNVNGNLSGQISVASIGGDAETDGSGEPLDSAGAGASAFGILGNIGGDISGNIFADAQGGTSLANGENTTYPNAHSHATVQAVKGNVGGNISGTIKVEAIGGDATVIDSLYKEVDGAVADSSASGINGDVSGSVTGEIILASKAGKATSNINAYASAVSYGLRGKIVGDVSGDIQTIAEGGSVSAGEKAYANATSKGIVGDVEGDISGIITVKALGGKSLTAGAMESLAEGLAYGIHGSVGGNISGHIDVSATGGSVANGSAFNSARAIAFGVTSSNIYNSPDDTDGNIGSNLSGIITVKAKGGYAESVNDKADAQAYSFGIKSYIEGDVSGTIMSFAQGGTANSTNGSAHAAADSCGMEGYISGAISGSVNAFAQGGVADGSTAVASAKAYGIKYLNPLKPDDSSAGDSDSDGTTGGVVITGPIVERIVPEWPSAIGEATSRLSTNTEGEPYFVFTNGDIVDESDFDGDYTEAPDRKTSCGAKVLVKAIAGTVNGKSDYALAVGFAGGRSLDLSESIIKAEAFTNDGVTRMIHTGDSYDDGSAGSFAAVATENITAFNSTILGAVDVTDGDLSLGNSHFTTLGRSFVETMTVDGGSTLGFELYEDAYSLYNSKIDATGDVVLQDGTKIRLTNAPGQSADEIIGNSYELVTSDTNLNVNAENLNTAIASIFEADYTVEDNSLTAEVTAIKEQDIVSMTQANTAAVNTLGQTVSKACNVMRSMVRKKAKTQTAANELPKGALLTGAMLNSGYDSKTSGWLSYFRQFNDFGALDSDGTTPGSEWNSNGFMTGLEKLYENKLILGIAGGGSWTDLDGKDGSGGGFSKMFLATAYANYFTNSWYGEAGLIYGRAWNYTERFDTAGDRYEGDYNSDYFGGWLEAGFIVWENESNMLEPYGRLTYISGHHDSYTDEGGAAPMTISDNNTDNLLGEAGLRYKSEWNLATDSKIRTELKVGTQYEFLDQNVVTNAEIIGVGQTIESPDADRLALVLGARVDWVITDALEFGVSYEPTLSGNWYNHMVDFTLKYAF